MTREELFERFQADLPGEDAHIEFSPMRGRSSEIISKYPNHRESAVAILLFFKNNQLHTLITERQTYKGQHSGQMSFPGGKKEENDIDLNATASRECFEEIGICVSDSEYIKDLTPVFIPVSNFLVVPKMFFLESVGPFTLSNREVAAIHEINLMDLFLPTSITHQDIKMDGNIVLKQIPHFTQNDVHIWGATALMLNELKQLLIQS